MTGIYRVIDGQAQFAECSTGLHWPVAAGPEADSLGVRLRDHHQLGELGKQRRERLFRDDDRRSGVGCLDAFD